MSFTRSLSLSGTDRCPESGLEEAALKRVKNGKLYLIPASDETRGHLTTGMAKFYSQQLQQLLQTAAQRPM